GRRRQDEHAQGRAPEERGRGARGHVRGDQHRLRAQPGSRGGALVDDQVQVGCLAAGPAPGVDGQRGDVRIAVAVEVAADGEGPRALAAQLVERGALWRRDGERKGQVGRVRVGGEGVARRGGDGRPLVGGRDDVLPPLRHDEVVTAVGGGRGG